jgi:hypothetical protein
VAGWFVAAGLAVLLALTLAAWAWREIGWATAKPVALPPIVIKVRANDARSLCDELERGGEARATILRALGLHG